MTKENRLYFILAFIFIIGISIWLYQSKEINNEDKVELITFEQFKKIESLTKDTISEEGVLYDVSNGILYYPNRNKDRYETMVDLKYPEIFGTAEVLFSGNGSDFHRFVKELVFLKDRNDHAYSDGFKNIKDGAIEGAKDTANGLKNILMHPYESAKGVVQTIANIPAATWGAINGEYSLEGIKNFMEAFYYNEENKNALKNDLIYEKCYLQKTKDEIRQYTNEIIGGNAVIQIVAMLAPGAVISKVGKSAQVAELTSRALKIKEISQITEEVSKLKPALKLEKLADYLFEHKKPAIPSKLLSLQSSENKFNFQEKLGLVKEKKTSALTVGEIENGRTFASKILGNNLIKAGINKPAGTAAHHIVAYTDKKAFAARNVLDKYKIDINSSENGVWLPHSEPNPTNGIYHREIHTAKYHEEVNSRILQAKSRDEAIEILKDIRNELNNGTFPY